MGRSRPREWGAMSSYLPLLVKETIMVFDDCSESLPGGICALHSLLRDGACDRPFSCSDALAATLVAPPGSGLLAL
jgi:hypothetical protein